MPLPTSFDRDRVLEILRFRIGLECGEWNTTVVIPIRPFEENQIVLHSRKVSIPRDKYLRLLAPLGEFLFTRLKGLQAFRKASGLQ